MQYIRSTQNESGAYPAPQSNPFSGALTLADEQAAALTQYNGFVTLTVEGSTATAVTPNTDAWEAWKASLPDESDPEPTAQDDIYSMMIDHEYRLTLIELGVTEGV